MQFNTENQGNSKNSLIQSSTDTIVSQNNSTVNQEYSDSDSFLSKEEKFIAERTEVIKFLLDNGYVPLPVAPFHSAKMYPAVYQDKKTNEWVKRIDKDGNPIPRFTGKNPSYFVSKGGRDYPKTVNHRLYQDKLPTKKEVSEWFLDERVGVGTLGGWNNTIWIDFDVKNFDNLEDCKTRVESWIAASNLSNTWIERTHSGGYRVAVRCRVIPEFTNFSLDGIGGKHHGEALGEGRFTVLAPTIGVSGDSYVGLKRAVPVEVESLESIGIYPVSNKDEKGFKSIKSLKVRKKSESNLSLKPSEDFKDKVNVSDLLSSNAKKVLKGENIKNDRSASLVLLINDLAGSQLWLNGHSIGIQDDIERLIIDAGESLGIDNSRVHRIIESTNIYSAKPAIYYQEGDIGCWKKLKSVNIEVFNTCCTDENIKKQLEVYSYKLADGSVYESSKPITFNSLLLWWDSQKYTSTITINEQEFQYPDIPLSNAIIGVKSPMGTGKTQSALELIKAFENNVCCFWLAPRVKLILQTESEAFKKGIKMYILNDDGSQELIFDSGTHLALCPESIHKIRGNFQGKDIWIDEATCALKQILSGGTISGSAQGLCLEVLAEAFKACNRVFLLDANLADKDVDLVFQLAPNKEVVKILNEHPVRKAKITIIKAFTVDKEGNVKFKAKDKSVILNRFINAENPLMMTDNKGLSLDLLQLMINNEKWGFSLNRKTTEETWGEFLVNQPIASEYFKKIGIKVNLDAKWSDEFLQNPNVFLIKYQPQFFIASPTIESGVSITLNQSSEYKFSVIFACFDGTIGTDSQIQMLFRSRDTEIERVVYVPDRGLFPEKVEPTLELFKQSLEDEIKIALELKAEARGSHFQDVFEKAKNRINPIWAGYSVLTTVLSNFEKNCLRDCLVYKLRQIGHIVNIEEEESINKINDDVKEQKKARQKEEARDIFNAIPYESIEVAKQEHKKHPNDSKVAIRKKITTILHKLPEIKNSGVWNEDFILECYVKNNKLESTMNKLFLLFNPDIDSKQSEYWDYLRLSSEHVTLKAIKNDVELSLYGLRELGIDEFIKKLYTGFQFSSDSPEIVEIVEKARNHEKLKKIRQFKIKLASSKGAERINYVKELLSIVGIEIKAGKKEQLDSDNVRKHFYSLKASDIDKYKKAMLEAIGKYYERWIDKDYQKPEWDYLKQHGELPVGFKQSAESDYKGVESGSNYYKDKEKNEPVNNEFPLAITANNETFIINDDKHLDRLLTTCRKRKENKLADITCEKLLRESALLLEAYNKNSEITNIIDAFDCRFSELIDEDKSMLELIIF